MKIARKMLTSCDNGLPIVAEKFCSLRNYALFQNKFYYTPLRTHWVVERTNAWNGRDRRNSKDYERKPASSAVMMQMSNINRHLSHSS